jgi:F0F1-type ATP synthase alpha subunit
MREKYPEVGEKIRREKQLDADTERTLRQAIEAYKQQFLKEHGLA